MPFKKGQKPWNYNGGRWKSQKGYWWVAVPVDHPCNRAGSKGYAPEHLLVFYNTHGRLPFPLHHIHHIDENKENNSPENLQELYDKDHAKHHLTSRRAKALGAKGGKKSKGKKRRRKQ